MDFLKCLDFYAKMVFLFLQISQLKDNFPKLDHKIVLYDGVFLHCARIDRGFKATNDGKNFIRMMLMGIDARKRLGLALLMLKNHRMFIYRECFVGSTSPYIDYLLPWQCSTIQQKFLKNQTVCFLSLFIMLIFKMTVTSKDLSF